MRLNSASSFATTQLAPSNVAHNIASLRRRSLNKTTICTRYELWVEQRTNEIAVVLYAYTGRMRPRRTTSTSSFEHINVAAATSLTAVSQNTFCTDKTCVECERVNRTFKLCKKTQKNHRQRTRTVCKTIELNS